MVRNGLPAPVRPPRAALPQEVFLLAFQRLWLVHHLPRFLLRLAHLTLRRYPRPSPLFAKCRPVRSVVRRWMTLRRELMASASQALPFQCLPRLQHLHQSRFLGSHCLTSNPCQPRAALHARMQILAQAADDARRWVALLRFGASRSIEQARALCCQRLHLQGRAIRLAKEPPHPCLQFQRVNPKRRLQ